MNKFHEWVHEVVHGLFQCVSLILKDLQEPPSHLFLITRPWQCEEHIFWLSFSSSFLLFGKHLPGGGEGISSKLQSASTTSDDYAYFVEDTTRHGYSHIELPLFIAMVQCNSHVIAIFTVCSHIWWWDSHDIGKPPRDLPLSTEVITVLLYNAWDESMRREAPIPFWLVAYQNTYSWSCMSIF